MKIQLRRDAFTNWASNGTVLLDGEIAYSSTNNHIKIGNGFDTYENLPSFIKFPRGNVVNTTATQTLTNKTFVGGSFNTNQTVTSLETNLEATTLNLTKANVITVNAETVVSSVGAGFQNMEVLTTVGTGTWTLPTALRRIGAKFKVTAVGGGAGGASETGTGDRGPGGGSGAVVIGFYTVNNLANTSMSYGVGAGGLGGGLPGAGNDGQAGSPSNTTYNGITFSAGGAAAVIKDTTPGGTGGIATGGTLNYNGFNGHQGTISKEATNSTIFGKGADTPLGFGQGGDIVLSSPATSTGSTASGYGSGGSGADGDGGAGAANRDGTSGAQGIIIIEY